MPEPRWPTQGSLRGSRSLAVRVAMGGQSSAWPGNCFNALGPGWQHPPTAGGYSAGCMLPSRPGDNRPMLTEQWRHMSACLTRPQRHNAQRLTTETVISTRPSTLQINKTIQAWWRRCQSLKWCEIIEIDERWLLWYISLSFGLWCYEIISFNKHIEIKQCIDVTHY